MTQSYVLTLPDTSWHSLFSLMMLDTRFSGEVNAQYPTFTSTPFTPSMVSEFELTGSATTNIAYDSNDEIGEALAAATLYKRTASNNRFNLKNIFVKGTSSATINFSFTAI